MARSRRFSPTPFIRSLVRSLTRRREAATDIANAVTNQFANVNRTALNTMIRQERQRQDKVDAITNLDMRRNVDLKRLIGCGRKTPNVRVRITLVYTDPTTGAPKEFGHTTTLTPTGRAANLVNAAIADATKEAQGKGYQLPKITSAQQSGSNYYRLEYVECY